MTTVLDLDGVLRLWPANSEVEALETRHGLPRRTFATLALDQQLLTLVTTGRLSKAEWRSLVASQVGKDATDEWFNRPTTIDATVLAEVDALRANGTRVVLFSNGTDELDDELERLDLLVHFDRVYNSAALGWCKPAPQAFAAVCKLEQCKPASLWLVDDRIENIRAAVASGWQATLYKAGRGIRRTTQCMG